MITKKAMGLAAAMLGLATLFACSDHDGRKGTCGTKGGGGLACGEPEIVGFAQEVPNQRVLCVGESIEIEARLANLGTGASSPIEWTMSRPSYVTLEPLGLKARITGVGVGSSYVKATQTCDGNFAVANFEVRNCRDGGVPPDASGVDASGTDASSVDAFVADTSVIDATGPAVDSSSPADTRDSGGGAIPTTD